jgi:haloacetate dehalogenase
MALDHPGRIQAVSVLDIIPTSEMYRRADMSFGLGYWQWFFLPQPYDFPEPVIGANPDGFFFYTKAPFFDPAACAEYRRCYSDPATIHAMCDDYRAGASFDLDLDESDRKAGSSHHLPAAGLMGRSGLRRQVV